MILRVTFYRILVFPKFRLPLNAFEPLYVLVWFTDYFYLCVHEELDNYSNNEVEKYARCEIR